MERLRVFSSSTAQKAIEALRRQSMWAIDISNAARRDEKVDVIVLGNDACEIIIACDSLSEQDIATIFHELSLKHLIGWRCKELLKSFHAYDVLLENWADCEVAELLLAGGKSCLCEPVDLIKSYIGEEIHALEDGEDEYELLLKQTTYLYQVFFKQLDLLEQDMLHQIFMIECKLIPILVHLEQVGVPFQLSKWQKTRQAIKKEVSSLFKDLQEQLEKTAGYNGPVTFNADISEDEWAALLNGLGYRVNAVNKAVLDNISGDVGEYLRAIRANQFLLKQYGKPFERFCQDDGRIHASFDALGASTGRIACSDPNLQAISSDTKLRQCFCVDAGKKIVSADYSGAELRILAELSQEPQFISAFNEKQDLHALVASKIFQKPVSKTENSQLRQQAKVINFGLAYGMGIAGLSRAARINHTQARKLLEQYQRKFPRLFTYLRDNARLSMERGYAVTLAGRRRYLEGLDTASLDRLARNTPIQGTGADIIKIALIGISSELRVHFPQASLINTIHDQVLVECPEQQAALIAKLVEFEMLQAGGVLLKKVPMEVEVEITDWWSH